jgi:hypothetical protein
VRFINANTRGAATIALAGTIALASQVYPRCVHSNPPGTPIPSTAPRASHANHNHALMRAHVAQADALMRNRTRPGLFF